MAIFCNDYAFCFKERSRSFKIEGNGGFLSFKGQAILPVFCLLPCLCDFFLLRFGQSREARKFAELGEEIDAEAAEEFLHFADMNGLRHFFKRRFHRNISLDRSELVGKVCHVFSGSELLSLCALDFIDMRIEIVERLVLRQKLQRCLFADARNARDVVGGIAHERFHVDDLGRRDAVLFLDSFRRHFRHGGNSLLRKVDGRPVACQLQRIAVPCHDSDRQFLFIACRKRAQDIVAFIAGKAVDSNAHDMHDLKDEIELRNELGRSRLSCRFVPVIHFHAERLAVFIEGDSDISRIKLAVKREQHAKKTIDGIRRHAVRRRHRRRKRIKRAVQKAAAIDDG